MAIKEKLGVFSVSYSLELDVIATVGVGKCTRREQLREKKEKIKPVIYLLCTLYNLNQGVKAVNSLKV